MKRLLRGTLFVLMMTAFIACSGKDEPQVDPPTPPQGDEEVELVLSLAKASVNIGETAKFTVSSEVAAEADIVITVSSNNTDAVTVPATVTLKAGSNSVEGDFTGVVGGSATITISATGTKIKTASQVVKVIGASEVQLNIAAEKTDIYTQNLIKFTITSPIAPKADVVIALTSSRPSIATVTETVTLKAGETSVSGDIVGVSAGKSVITIFANNVAIGTDKVEITVSEKPAIMLSIGAPTNVIIGNTVKVTVSTPGAATEKLTVTLSNDNTAATELGTTTLSIEAGATSAETTLKGLAVGESNISFTVSPSSVLIDKGSVKVFSGNARTDIVPFAVPASVTIPEGTQGNNWGAVNLNDNTTLTVGLWTTTGTWLETQVGTLHKITIENYGHDWVGEMRNGYGVFTPVAEGTLINKQLPWMKGSDSPRTRPAVWTQDGYSVGENAYVVLYAGNGPGQNFKRAWMKVTITPEGKLTVLDGALCTSDDDNVSFRVGEK